MNAPPMFRVLLLKDSAHDAAVNQRELSCDPQFTLTHVERLDEAISELRNVQTDAVILDLGLSGSNEVDSLITLRKHAQQVPIIVLASAANEQRALAAAREGADGYFVKGETADGQLWRAARFLIERDRSKLTRGGHAPITAASNDARVGEIAHTLNNLLTVIIGQTEIAKNKLPQELLAQSDLAEALVAAERATHLTEELLHIRQKGPAIK